MVPHRAPPARARSRRASSGIRSPLARRSREIDGRTAWRRACRWRRRVRQCGVSNPITSATPASGSAIASSGPRSDAPGTPDLAQHSGRAAHPHHEQLLSAVHNEHQSEREPQDQEPHAELPLRRGGSEDIHAGHLEAMEGYTTAGRERVAQEAGTAGCGLLAVQGMLQRKSLKIQNPLSRGPA